MNRLHTELQAALDRGVTEEQLRRVTGLSIEVLRNYADLHLHIHRERFTPGV